MMQQRASVSDRLHLLLNRHLPHVFPQPEERKVKTEQSGSTAGCSRRAERCKHRVYIRVNMEEVLAPLREAVREQVRYYMLQ